jgi:hypothetical protein
MQDRLNHCKRETYLDRFNPKESNDSIFTLTRVRVIQSLAALEKRNLQWQPSIKNQNHFLYLKVFEN